MTSPSLNRYMLYENEDPNQETQSAVVITECIEIGARDVGTINSEMREAERCKAFVVKRASPVWNL